MRGTASGGYNTIVGVDGAPQMAVASNQWTVGNAGSSNPFVPSQGIIYEATMNMDGLGSLMVNNESTGLKRAGTCTPKIFSNSNGGTYARIYSVKYINRNNNSIIANFIPCYLKNDNDDNIIVGLYNTVNGTFYTNQGSGTFSKGDNNNTLVNYSTNVTTINSHTLTAIWEENNS